MSEYVQSHNVKRTVQSKHIKTVVRKDVYKRQSVSRMTRRTGRINKHNKTIAVAVHANFFNVHIITRRDVYKRQVVGVAVGFTVVVAVGLGVTVGVAVEMCIRDR